MAVRNSFSPNTVAQSAKINENFDDVESGLALNDGMANSPVVNNNVGVQAKDTGGTKRDLGLIDSSNIMKIGSSAVVAAFLTKIKAGAYRNGNVADSVDNSLIQLNAELYDTNGNFDHVTNFNYTVPVTGYYLVTASAGIGSVIADTVIWGIDVRVSGTAKLWVNTQSSGSGGLSRYVSVSRIIKMTAGEDVALYLSLSSGVVLLSGTATITSMTIHLLSID